MLFSVVVPVYNVEKYIDECLQSLSNQTMRDFEIVLVDDGSTDQSGKICDAYAKTQHNTKVIHKANEGLIMARRTGIKECVGDYIIHCDSDDYLAENALEEISAVIKRNHPDMVMYGCEVVDDSHRVKEKHFTIFDDNQIFDKRNKEELIAKVCSTGYLNSMWSKATKRELVDVDKDYSKYKSINWKEDLLQVIPLIEKSNSFIYIAKPLYYYRYNPSGISAKMSSNYLRDHILVFERLYEYLQNANVTEKTFYKFYNLYVRDIFKYILRFTKDGMTKNEYQIVLKKIKSDAIYREAEKHYDKWSKENKIFRAIVKEKNYKLAKILANTVYARKV